MKSELGKNPAAFCHEQAADTVMFLALTLARRAAADGASSALSGRTLGLVGFDDVAKAVAKRAAHGFGMRVLVYGASGQERAVVRQLGAGVAASLSDLLGASDFVSLHDRPGGGAAWINAHRLDQMKPDACLINTADGDLMDEQDLMHALWFETIGGAGISVPAETLDRLKDFQACHNAVVLPREASRRRTCETPAPFQCTGNVVQLFERRHQVG